MISKNMRLYALDISDWAEEKMPDSDDFDVIFDYIKRNKEAYKNRDTEDNALYWEIECKYYHRGN